MIYCEDSLLEDELIAKWGMHEDKKI